MTPRAKATEEIRVSERTQFVVSSGVLVGLVLAAFWIATQLTGIKYEFQELRKDLGMLTRIVDHHSELLEKR